MISSPVCKGSSRASVLKRCSAREQRGRRDDGGLHCWAWAATAGHWLQAKAPIRAGPAKSSLSRGPSPFCTCVQITWHLSLRWFSSRPRSWLRLQSRHQQRSAPSAGDICRDRADALYVYQKDGAWRLQNPNQQRMLVKIKNLDLSSVPYL